ncbi:MAG TPA: ATP-binding protein, partial [Spirochaetota bacterium]|nr:ATP-binding protein [Spirochaetota bacterium]
YVVSVEDKGIGIEQEKIKNIFDPFFTTKKHKGGTGLGLAMVSSIVSKHLGFIQVSSALNKGSAFRIFLPAI